MCISRVPDQNGVSVLYIMLEIHHTGREPSICCTSGCGLPSLQDPAVGVSEVGCGQQPT